MSRVSTGFPSPFTQYEIGDAYDEMFDSEGVAHEHYQTVYQRLLELEATELQSRQLEADRSFLHQGISFTVYGADEGTERIFPYDLLPRIITSDEWAIIERGLTQRITALNLFLRDIYHEGKIFSDGTVPRELVYSCKHYLRQMRGVRVPNDVYVVVVGTDLIRVASGEFVVLEDNLRAERRILYARQSPGDEVRLSPTVQCLRRAFD